MQNDKTCATPCKQTNAEQQNIMFAEFDNNFVVVVVVAAVGRLQTSCNDI